MLRAIPLICVVMVAGCGPRPFAYSKPGVTYREWKHDDAGCREAARDVSVAGGVNLDAFNRCMHGLGYPIPRGG